MIRKTVLVTGASGYIARHILLRLLDSGYNVRGSLRRVEAGGEIASALRPHLADASNLEERLSFVRLDLERDEGWQEALTGVDALIHTASPFPLTQPRDESELVRPAVEGTLRALRAARDAGVDRVVITSSTAAVVCCDLPAGRKVYDERDWSDPSHRTSTPYTRSKTLAERAAWRFVDEQAPDLRLITINPGFVVGPALGGGLGTSMSVIQRLLNAKDPALPNVGFPVVDVRDVAHLHVAALDTPAAVGKRFLCVDEFLTFRDMAITLSQAFPARRIVTRQAPDFFIRMLGWFDRSIATIAPELGRQVQVSTQLARDTFAIQFRPAREAIVAGARNLIERGLVA